jgi:HemY protein
MRYYIITTLVLLALVGLAYISGSDLGLVTFTYQTFTYETSLMTCIILVGVCFIMMRMIASIFDLPALITQIMKKKHQAKLKYQIQKGLNALLNMDFEKAINQLNQISEKSKRGVFINALSAQIAYINDMPNPTKLLLASSLPKYPNEQIFIKLLVADYALRYKDNELAKNILYEDAALLSCNWGKFLKALYLLEANEYNAAIQHIKDMPLNNENAEVKLLSILFDKISKTSDLLHYEKIEPLRPNIKRAFLKSPKAVAGLSLFEYRHQHYERAAELMLNFIKATWSQSLLAQYGEYEKINNEEKLSFLERQLEKHASCHALNYALAQTCKHLSLWGKARSYVDESIKMLNTKKGLILSADLYLRENQQNEALSELKRAAYTKDSFN